jgi:hypothetical protein
MAKFLALAELFEGRHFDRQRIVLCEPRLTPNQCCGPLKVTRPLRGLMRTGREVFDFLAWVVKRGLGCRGDGSGRKRLRLVAHLEA